MVKYDLFNNELATYELIAKYQLDFESNNKPKFGIGDVVDHSFKLDHCELHYHYQIMKIKTKCTEKSQQLFFRYVYVFDQTREDSCGETHQEESYEENLTLVLSKKDFDSRLTEVNNEVKNRLDLQSIETYYDFKNKKIVSVYEEYHELV